MNQKPNVFLYFLNWNDPYYIPFIKKHYGAFCSRIIMYDNYSTDNSVSIAKDLGMEVRNFGIKGTHNEGEHWKVKNNCWKEARGEADYVIICDVDEFLFHTDIEAMLKECKKQKISIPLITGYDMFSNHTPVNSLLEVSTGIRSKKYSKNIIFDPNMIEEINYNHGSHRIKPVGEIRKGGHFKMLHYRNIGGVDRTIARHLEYKQRMSEFNIKNGYAKEYMEASSDIKELWESNYEKSKEIKWDYTPFSIWRLIRKIW